MKVWQMPINQMSDTIAKTELLAMLAVVLSCFSISFLSQMATNNAVVSNLEYVNMVANAF